MQKKICAVYGEGAVTDWICQKWFVKFCDGDFSLEDAPKSGRPVKVDSDQIETSIENNQCYTMQEIANILKRSKSITLLVKMKNVSFILWKKSYRLFAQPNNNMAHNLFNSMWLPGEITIALEVFLTKPRVLSLILFLWQIFSKFPKIWTNGAQGFQNLFVLPSAHWDRVT